MDIDPKMVVMAAIIVPVVYQFLEWDFTVWALVALAAAGWHYHETHFINKATVEKKAIPSLGPPQPFLPQEKQWEIDPVTGTPIPKYQPPEQSPPQQYQQPR